MILSNTTLPKCRNQASPSAEDAIVNNESFRRHPPPAGIREPAQYNRKVDGSMTAEYHRGLTTCQMHEDAKTTSDLEINKDKKPPPPSMLAISTDQKLNSKCLLQ